MRVGIFAGLERAFPAALIDQLNRTTIAGERVVAELPVLGAVPAAPAKEWDLLVDRISHEIHYYRVYCKVAALAGTYIINNPFWFCADDKFFGYSLAKRLGVAVPRTCILPSKAYPSTLTPYSYRNLAYPLDWEQVFQRIGFPAFLKQHMGGGWANVHKVHNPEELLRAYDASGELVMVLQEAIAYEHFFRCLVIGRRHVLPLRYDPQQRRAVPGDEGLSGAMLDQISEQASRLSTALGYDMNSVEFAIRDGVPYAIDFTNPGPDFDPAAILPQSFDWVIARFVDTIREILERPAPAQPPLCWQELLRGDAGSPPTGQAAQGPDRSPPGTG